MRQPSERQREAARECIAQRERLLRCRLNYGERMDLLSRSFAWSPATIRKLVLDGLDAQRQPPTGIAPRVTPGSPYSAISARAEPSCPASNARSAATGDAL